MGIGDNGVPEEDRSSMAFWLEEYEKDVTMLRPGQVVSGTVMEVRPNEVLIDVGAKAEGIVGREDLDKLSKEQRALLEEGAEIRVFIVRPEGDEGNPLLSITRAKIEEDWEVVEQARETDDIIEAEITGVNKGGLIAHVGQVRGFVPASQVASIRRQGQEAPEAFQRRLQSLVGQSLKLKVLDLDRERNRLIMSERAAQREWRRDRKEELLDSLSKGMTLKGEISSLADFGAFVDLGGADGLIHLSELSWGRVQHPSEVVQVGQEVEVYVLNVDTERRRIGLSLKRLQPEPWTDFVEQFKVGDELDAIVTKLTSFGAFARLTNYDLEGLIHISELADSHIEHPSEVVHEGKAVRVRIIRIEPERKRLGLSLRAPARDDADDDWDDTSDADLSDTDSGDTGESPAAVAGDAEDDMAGAADAGEEATGDVETMAVPSQTDAEAEVDEATAPGDPAASDVGTEVAGSDTGERELSEPVDEEMPGDMEPDSSTVT
jgi:small subunit ribosomal protein S1